MLRQSPYGNRLIVEVTGAQTITSSGGAILSQSDTAMGATAIILAKGNNCNHPMCEVGNEIIYPPHLGFDVHLDGKKYRTLLEQEVWFFQEPSTETKAVDKVL